MKCVLTKRIRFQRNKYQPATYAKKSNNYVRQEISFSIVFTELSITEKIVKV